MLVSISKWRFGSQFPLIFMIDDLANIDFNLSAGDWGARQNKPDSMYRFLKNKYISLCPELKFTFFAVAGKRCIQSTGNYDYVEDCSMDNFPNFLNFLCDEGHEVAYHGLSHGSVVNEKFIQEWDHFSNQTEANVTVQEGVDLLSQSSSTTVIGGKYCGYKAGAYGHESLISNGFKWWFDSWDSNHLHRPDGEWVDNIFYFPSNIDCSAYTIDMIGRVPFGKYLKSTLKDLGRKSIKRKMLDIIEAKGILTFQEHTSPIRTDHKTQFPNVFHDCPQIISLLKIVNRYEPWFATATEVYTYQLLRSCSVLSHKNENMHLEYVGTQRDAEFLVSQNATISLELQGQKISGKLGGTAYERHGKSILDVPLALFVDNPLLINHGT
jgi:hypothetical protein